MLTGSVVVDEEKIRHTGIGRISRLRLPDVLMVVTGGEQAYTRADGVRVIPISALKQ